MTDQERVVIGETTGVHIALRAGEIIAADWEAVAALHAKISAASADVASVSKDARNEFHRYEYTSYGALAAAANHALAAHGLAFGVGIDKIELSERQGAKSTMQIALAHIEATLTDTETGAMRVYRWIGMGEDSADKGAAKALTSGVKYGLMRSLLVSDQEADPDNEGVISGQQNAQPTRSEEGPAHEAKPQRVATKPAATRGETSTAESAFAKAAASTEPVTLHVGDIDRHWCQTEYHRNAFHGDLGKMGLGHDDVIALYNKYSGKPALEHVTEIQLGRTTLLALMSDLVAIDAAS